SHVVRRQDARQVARLLRRTGRVDQYRADDVHGDRVEDLGGARPGHLLGEDDLLLQRRAAAAVRPGPLDADPARRRQLALPGALERASLVLVLRRRRARQMSGKPATELRPEGLLLGGVSQHIISFHFGPRLRLGPRARVWRAVERADGVPRPAKPARQNLARSAGAAWEPRGSARVIFPGVCPTRRGGRPATA